MPEAFNINFELFFTGVDEYTSCNLGHVPSNILMTSSNKSKSEIQKYKEVFLAAQKTYGPTSSNFKMFSSDNFQGRDLIFSDNTRALRDVGDKNNYKKWLGKELIDTIAEIECDNQVTTANNGATTVNGVAGIILITYILHGI